MNSFDFSLKEVADLLEGARVNGDATFNRVSIDTRQIQPGDCFIALKGARVNGHEYIAEAAAKGAVAVIGSEPMAPLLPTLQVDNVKQALLTLAKRRREQITVPVIAITGSCGKTTTKMLLASILKGLGRPVHCAEKSFNNAIGLPLTLLQAQPHQAYVVLEVGTNYPGEIAALTAVAQPTVSIITNAAPVHLEGLGSVEGVAKEKGAMVSGTAPQGTVVLNGDDSFYPYWQQLAGHRKVVTVAMGGQGQWQGRVTGWGDDQYPHCEVTTPEGAFRFTLPLVGDHNAANALSASAAAYEVGAPLEVIKEGLEQNHNGVQRMTVHSLAGGATLIDDSYNANPHAMAAALQLLSRYQGRKKILVLGDMGELGSQAVHYHDILGTQARLAGVDALYALGDLSRQTVQAFGESGYHFHRVEPLLSALRVYGRQDDTVILVKGSRSMALERVVQPLLKEFK